MYDPYEFRKETFGDKTTKLKKRFRGCRHRFFTLQTLHTDNMSVTLQQVIHQHTTVNSGCTYAETIVFIHHDLNYINSITV